MIRPILACADPYKAAESFAAARWNIDFSQSPESGDPLVGVSLCGNSVGYHRRICRRRSHSTYWMRRSNLYDRTR